LLALLPLLALATALLLLALLALAPALLSLRSS